jgi:hypothetical protein
MILKWNLRKKDVTVWNGFILGQDIIQWGAVVSTVMNLRIKGRRISASYVGFYSMEFIVEFAWRE